MSDADPAKQIRKLDARRAKLREQFDRADGHLALQRGQLVRDLVGDADQRGAIQRAATDLDVTWTQVQRLLGEHDARRVRLVLATAGWELADYKVRAAGQHAAVTLIHGDGDHRVARMNAASALLNALRDAGYEYHGDDLAVDVDGHGPLAALTRGDAITVTIPDDAPQCLTCGRPGPADDICEQCSAGGSILPPDDEDEETSE